MSTEENQSTDANLPVENAAVEPPTPEENFTLDPVEPPAEPPAEPFDLNPEPSAAQPTEAQTAAQAQALEELNQMVGSLKSQVEERTNQYMRIAADFDNFRKRTQKEREELEQQVKCNTIMELLSVVDNFERARSQLKPQTDGEMSIHKSYQGVYKQLVDALKRIGVAPMRAEGKEFDPNLHEAMMIEPTDQHPEGTVIEEFMRGYLLGDRVLRHAKVKVAAAAEPASETAES